MGEARFGVVVNVADLPVRLNTSDAALHGLLEGRFSRFLRSSDAPQFEFDVTVVPSADRQDRDLEVACVDGRWTLRRGDFEAEWSVRDRRGWIRQTLTPYAADSVLRILHSVVLAGAGGFLVHASSAIRNGRALIFTGPSGAGKSTIVRLAPAGVTVLTDEISYVRREAGGYVAYGTPFAGELSETGTPERAPIASVFRLARGNENVRAPLERAAAVQTLMRNILFFADDASLVEQVLDTVCDFVARVPCEELAFVPHGRVWEMLG